MKMDMSSILEASSPAPSPQYSTSEIVTAITFCIGVLLLIVLITIGSYHCTTRVQPTIPPDHHHQSSTINPTTAAAAAKQKSGGLDEVTLGSYQKNLYSEIKVRSSSSSAACCSGCSICLADYNDADWVLLLPDCAHLFHEHCIKQWLRLHPTCPICRNSPLPVAHVVPLPISQFDHHDANSDPRQNFQENNNIGDGM